MLHYFARTFFSNIIVSPYLEDDTLVVYYIDDGVRQESQTTAAGKTTETVKNKMQVSVCNNMQDPLL